MGFKYFKPQNLVEAVNKAKSSSAPYFLSGGSDLMVKIRNKVLAPEILIDVTGIEELNGISEDENTVTVGAAATHMEIAKSEIVQKHIYVLAEGSASVGSPQIRNSATVGGNICNASPAADSVPPLMVLDGEVTLFDGENYETVALDQFFNLPGKPHIKKEQVLVNIKVNKIKANQGASFYKIGKRKSLAIAVLNGASFLHVEDNKIVKARVVLGSVAAKTIRLYEVEKWLTGKEPTEENFIKAGEMGAQMIVPIDDVRSTKEYRTDASAGVIKKTLMAAYNNCKEA